MTAVAHERIATNGKAGPRTTAQKPPGRLLAITASGPIYRTPATFTAIPLSSALELHRELAARTRNPRAKVVSSLASRLHGEAAYSAWMQLTSTVGASIVNLSPAERVSVLRQVLQFVRRRGADGNETVLAAAVNGAWPYLAAQDLEPTLQLAKSAIHRATFSDTVATAVVDPAARRVTFHPPGALKAIDPVEWLIHRRLHIDEWRLFLPKRDVDVPGLPSIDDSLGQFGDIGGSYDPTKDPGFTGTHGNLPGRRPAGQGSGMGRFGGDIGGSYDPMNDPGFTGTHGDLPGRRPTGQGSGLGGFGGDLGGSYDPMNDPGFTGTHGDLPGRRNGSAESGYRGGLLGGLGPGDFAADGGLLGFGSSLGPYGGSAPWTDEERSRLGHDLGTVGGVSMAYGGVLIGIGAIAEGVMYAGAASGVLTAGVGWAVAGVAAVVVGAVYMATYDEPDAPDDQGADTQQQQPQQQPQPKQERPQPKDEQPAPPPKPKEDPSQPIAEKDNYSDPFRHGSSIPDDRDGGGVSPTTIWDGDGGVGPTTIWEGDGGVGPTTIWDDNGGGGNPTTVGVRVTGTALTGSGLRAATIQVGPDTFAF